MHFKRSFRFSKIGNPKDVFTYFYTSNNWGNMESLSGHGSSVAYTENIRKEIPVLLNRLKVETLLDAPCGDYNWFRLVRNERNFKYLGGDIVAPLIEQNKQLYENEGTTFMEIDIIQDRLPAADIWLCRDCLFHFSYDDIFKTLHNFLQSDIRYLLTSTHSECTKNRNITTGDFRLINLELPPFNLAKPEVSIADWIEGFPVRHLVLWEKKELSEMLLANKHYLKTVKRFKTL